jgi:hypothetical protein
MTFLKRISLLFSILASGAALWMLNHPSQGDTVSSLRAKVATLDAEKQDLAVRLDAVSLESQSLSAERQSLSLERQALALERQKWKAQIEALQTNPIVLSQEVSGQSQAGGQALAKKNLITRAAAETNVSSEAETPFATAVLALASRAAELNRHFLGTPGREIPELQYLDEGDWLHLAKDARLDSPEGVRKALADARQQAKVRFAPILTGALADFLKANNAQPPISMDQLKPYFSVPVDDATLLRYQINTDPTGKQKFGSSTVISETAPVDPQYDSHFEIGLSGWSASTVRDSYSETVK